jgi:hypothetical protein
MKFEVFEGSKVIIVLVQTGHRKGEGSQWVKIRSPAADYSTMVRKRLERQQYFLLQRRSMPVVQRIRMFARHCVCALDYADITPGFRYRPLSQLAWLNGLYVGGAS